MSRMRALTIEVPEDIAEMVSEKVRSGEYASESDVVLDGLSALAEDQEQDQAALDLWIEKEVMPTLRAIEADPSLLMSPEEFRKSLHDYIDSFPDKGWFGAVLYRLIYNDAARDDVKEILEYLVPRSGKKAARSYVAEITDYCQGLTLFPNRGTLIDPELNLRTVGYKRKATIAFRIQNDTVFIVRIFHRGRNVELNESSLSSWAVGALST